MANGTSTDIYLDANATTRVLPAAADEALAAMEELFGNPSSAHITGIRARHILEGTRNLVRSVLGAESGQIIFTSGATEAIQSSIAANVLRRVGVENAWHIAGGLALGARRNGVSADSVDADFMI